MITLVFDTNVLLDLFVFNDFRVLHLKQALSTTPMPQRVKPGSIPSTRMSKPYLSCEVKTLEARQNFIGDIEIAIDILNVIELFYRIDQMKDLGGRFGIERD